MTPRPVADGVARPDGWSEDGRRMADTSPHGRHAVAKALRELTAHGYYRVDRVRRDDGTFVGEAHLYDTPQKATSPGLSRSEPGRGGSPKTPAPSARERGPRAAPPAPDQLARACAAAPSATWCYRGAMTAQPEITQRDLRSRSKEIMDAVQNGQSFTVTRDGHQIGELIPLRRRRRFVPRSEFAAMSRTASDLSLEAFRSDQDATAEQGTDDPYAR
ncbi:Antitoxin component of toxin-antitoxin stability system, DNA-binding transcriptional repressor [Streptomyces sp. DvalAA-14]|nr:Antitoxin component of toxin-antitoxin stability system, DNA-binding transcriptional repressor [Streptomyces sp. DvalAA-14]